MFSFLSQNRFNLRTHVMCKDMVNLKRIMVLSSIFLGYEINIFRKYFCCHKKRNINNVELLPLYMTRHLWSGGYN